MEAIAARDISTLYIILDLIWLLIYTAILLYSKRYMAIIVGLIAGIIYFIVDYGGFHLLLGTRQIEGANIFWFLLWLSMSVGFTNFAWIWLVLDRDGLAIEWSLLTILGWVGVAFISQSYGGDFSRITLSRTTSSYHGIMALILVMGYLILIIKNIQTPHQKANLLWLNLIGIGVQFSWEFVSFISGVRPVEFQTIIVRSLIETNLGMPYIYLIHQVVKARLSRRT